MSMSRDQIIADFKEKMKSLKVSIENLDKTVYEPLLDEKNEPISSPILPLDLYLKAIDVSLEEDELKAIRSMHREFALMEETLSTNPNFLNQQTIEVLKEKSEGFDYWIAKIKRVNAEVNGLIAFYIKEQVAHEAKTINDQELSEKIKALTASVKNIQGGTSPTLKIDIKHKAAVADTAVNKPEEANGPTVQLAPVIHDAPSASADMMTAANPIAAPLVAETSTKESKEASEEIRKDLISIKQYWVSIGQEESYQYRACMDLIEKINHNTFNMTPDSEDMKFIDAMRELANDYKSVLPSPAADASNIEAVANAKPGHNSIPEVDSIPDDEASHLAAVATTSRLLEKPPVEALSAASLSSMSGHDAGGAQLVNTLQNLTEQSRAVKQSRQQLSSGGTSDPTNAPILTAKMNANFPATTSAAKINTTDVGRNQYNELAKKSEEDFLSKSKASYKHYAVKSAEYIYEQFNLPPGNVFQVQSGRSSMTRSFVEDTKNGPEVQIKISAQSTPEQIADYLVMNKGFATPLVMQPNYPMFLKMVHGAVKAGMIIDQQSDKRQMQFASEDIERLKADTSFEAVDLKRKFAQVLNLDGSSAEPEVELPRISLKKE